MKKVLVILLVLFFSIAQISWGAFMYIGGLVFPLAIVGIWISYNVSDYAYSMVISFFVGIFIDALATTLFGYHSLIFLSVLTIMHLVQLKLVPDTIWGRVITLSIGIVAYYSLIHIVTRIISVI